MEKIKTSSEKRTIYLDILRILATLTVVFYHQTGVAKNPDISWSESFSLACDGVTRFCVPIFVMISGALFLDNSKPLSVKKLYRKNILRIVTAFIFWSVVYALYNFQSVVLFIEGVIMGRYHMWFLFMITGLYIVTPLLRKITVSKNTTEYFLIIGAVFGIGVSTFNSTPLANIAPGVTNYVFNCIDLGALGGYVFFFVLGYYLYKFSLPKWANTVLIVSGFLGCVLSIVLTIVTKNQSDAPYYYSHFFLPVTLECIAVFLVGKIFISKINFSEKSEKIIFKLSKYSFGVYLVHDLVLTVIRPFVTDYLGGLPVVAILVATAVTTIISFAISVVINKIPVLNKYVV